MDRKYLSSLGQQMKTSLLLFVLIFNWFPWTSDCCSPTVDWQPDTLERTVNFAESIVYGTVIEKYPSFIYPDSFTVTLEIHCVFKGEPVERQINVTNEGLTGGVCFFNNLAVNLSYVVYMNNRRIDIDPYVFGDAEREVANISDPFFDQLTRVCNLTTEYPIGMDPSNPNVQCPQTAKDPDCIRYTETPPTGEIPPEVTTSDIPPLKEFTPPQDKKDSKELPNVSESSKSGASSFGTGPIVTLTVLFAIGIVFYPK